MLALLVSFVTSIATGIVTVSLMDQAPQGVTQTINRVVEKTIERVVMEPAKGSQGAAVVTKETVIVKSDDAIVDAIAKNTKSIIRIREVTGVNETRRENFAGIGLVASSDGLIVADIDVAYRKADDNGVAIPESYIGVFPDGRIFPLNIVLTDAVAGLMFFQPLLQDKEKGVYRFTPPAFGTGALKLGQTVVTLGGSETNAASTGIISALNEKNVTKPAEEAGVPPKVEKTLISIKTDILSSELVPGAILLNLSGQVIGMSAGTANTSRNTFVPVQKIVDLLGKATTPVSATSTVN